MVTKPKSKRTTKPHGIWKSRADNTPKDEKIAALKAKIKQLEHKITACGSKQTRMRKTKQKANKR